MRRKTLESGMNPANKRMEDEYAKAYAVEYAKAYIQGIAQGIDMERERQAKEREANGAYY